MLQFIYVQEASATMHKIQYNYFAYYYIDIYYYLLGYNMHRMWLTKYNA